MQMSTRIWSKDFILLSLSNLFLFSSFFILLSSLPLFMVGELHARKEQVGLIIGIFTVAAVAMRPYAGMMLDQLERRKVVLFSMCLFVLATAGYFLVSTLVLLLVLRFIHGAAFGLSTTALGTVAVDLVPAERRGEGLGYFGTFNMLAMVIGPALGLIIIQKLSSGWLFFICFALAVIGLLFTTAIRYPRGSERSGNFKFKLSDWGKMIEPRALPYSLPLVGLAVVFGGIVSFISLYAVELGDSNLAGGFYFVYALALIVSRIVSGKLFDHKGSDVVVYPGIFCYIAGLTCLGWADGHILFYLAGALIGMGYGSIQPCLQALIIQHVPEHRRGAATATFFIAIDTGIGLGSFLLGFVVDWLGYRGMFLSTIAVVLISCILYWKARRHEKLTSIRRLLAKS
jgi:MFS family permease